MAATSRSASSTATSSRWPRASSAPECPAGDRVALLSKTRYEWTVADYAIWWTGAATVPIYETSSDGADRVDPVRLRSGRRDRRVRGAPREGQGGRLERTSATSGCSTAARIEQITARGADVSDSDVESRRSALTSDTLATLIYTSGTTGRPKGCKLTHGNFRYELGAAIPELPELFEREGASTLLFLPLAHVFARIIQVGAIRSGAKLGHTADVKDLVTHLGTYQPTFVLAVPRVFEKVFNTASSKAYADGKGKIFDRAAQTAIAYSKALDAGEARTRAAYAARLVRPARLRQAPRRPRRPGCSGRSPAAHRSATASPTSIAASASRSSRATD